MKYQARQTPKGHTTVWCGDTLVATISGSRFNREQRLDIAKRIAEALSNDKEEK